MSSPPLIRQLLYAAVIAGVTLLIIGLLALTKPDQPSARQPLVAVRVLPYTVQASDIQPQVRVTGRLQPANRALLRFELSGQLAERRVEPGQVVEVGTILLKLESGDAADALVESRAHLDMELAASKRDRRLLKIASKDLHIQIREVKRLKKLRSDSLISISLLDQARQRLLQLESSEAQLQYSVDTAKARLRTSRARLTRAQRNLDRTELRAPFSGTVNTVELEPGDYVSPTKNAVEMVDLAHIDMYAEVASNAAAALILGQKVLVTVAGNSYTGKVIALRSDPDPTTFTHALRIRLSGKGLLTGVLATANLPLKPLNNVLAVPISSLLQEGGRAYIFVIKSNKLERRFVETGTRYLEQIVISRGLAVGEVIIARDVAALTDGQAVVVKE